MIDHPYLMHETVTGTMNLEEARKVYAENMAAYTMGRNAPYTERLLFAVATEGTKDLDKSMMAGAMARQVVGKVNDVLTGSAETPTIYGLPALSFV
jgi:hypothetical protein